MKKYVMLLVVLLVLGWGGARLYFRPTSSAPEPSMATISPPESKPLAVPSPPPLPAPVAAVTPVPAPAATGVKVVQSSNPGTQPIDLRLVLDADNHYHDDVVGVSANVPPGWKVRQAIRWGDRLEQNTMWMQPEGPTTATPSMYYKPYTPNEATGRAGDAEGLLRSMAQSKEESRSQGGRSDYKNVPESFAFTTIDGNPALTYFATYTQGNDVKTEYFIRILGPSGYVMFFTQGRLEDVKAIMPNLQAMAGTVKIR